MLKIPRFKLMALALTAVLVSSSVMGCSSGTQSSADETSLIFTDSGITANNGAYTDYAAEGTTLTINGSGTYVVSGSCADGSIKIEKGTEGVTLVLNGLDLTSGDTAAIICGKSTEVNIEVKSGTENTLTDSAENNDDNYPDNSNAENAVIKCKDGSEVTISGGGTLNINANGKNGIKSGATTDEEGEASLTVKEAVLNITSENDGINAEQLLNIESGRLTIAAADDGVHCDYIMNVGADGMDGPTIEITECYEGLEAATLNIYSGDIKINAEDDCLNVANKDLSDYDFSVTIAGGTLYMYSATGDGIDSNGDINITGGTAEVWTASGTDNIPIDADGEVTITGGTILGGGGSAGVGGLNIMAEQSYVIFGSNGGFGPNGGKRPELPEGKTEGERPETPEEKTEGERPQPPENNGEGMQGLPGMQGNIFASAGSAVAIKDTDGDTVFEGTAPCDVGYVFFSSAELKDGVSYSLVSEETEQATAEAGKEPSIGRKDKPEEERPENPTQGDDRSNLTE